METISEGSYLLLYSSPHKKWLIRAASRGRFESHLGVVNLDDIIGKSYGSKITSSMNREMWLFKPTVRDFVMKSARETQIIYPKDAGYICAQVGLGPGMIVVEAGTGSGAMTTFLANIVKPHGHVYSYEVNDRFLTIAKKNLDKAGLLDFVTLKLADVKQGVDVRDADVAVLDIGDPWLAVHVMREALKPGGFLAAVTPTYNQVEKLCEELYHNEFVEVETVELMLRRLQVKPGMTRPETRMIAHTAFITTARKTH